MADDGEPEVSRISNIIIILVGITLAVGIVLQRLLFPQQ